MEQVARTGYIELLRTNRNFRRLWYGQIVSQLGDWFNLITLQVLLLQLTGSAQAIAALIIAQMLPLALLGPVAGVIVVRFSRRSVMIIADLVRAVIALGFLFIDEPSRAWMSYPLIAGLAVFTSVFEPARTASIPNVVGMKDLVTANALSAATWSFMLASGGLVGGAVAALFGRNVAFLLNSFSFLLSAGFIASTTIPQTRVALHDRDSGWRNVIDGFAYMGRHHEILPLLSVKMVWGLAGGISVLIAIFGQSIFPIVGGEALSVGILYAVSGLGTGLGPIVARRYAGDSRRRMCWSIAIGYAIGGVFTLLFARSSSLFMASWTLLLSRTGGSILWTFSTTLLQMASEDRFRGRVFAAEQTLFTLTLALSNYATGLLLDRAHLSPRFMAAVMGLLFVPPAVVWTVMLAARGGREEALAPVPGAARTRTAGAVAGSGTGKSR
ncbi:MAG: MFS transporter [Acidobacteria bacterium]|nr:MFS transporter [Acidobacteriota bacterium]